MENANGDHPISQNNLAPASSPPRSCLGRPRRVVAQLALVDHASDAWEWQDRIEFIPY